MWTFAISMGVRHRDQGLAQLLDQLLDREQPSIDAILSDYGVPVVGTDSVRREPDEASSNVH
jgi:hypothetical protein